MKVGVFPDHPRAVQSITAVLKDAMLGILVYCPSPSHWVKSHVHNIPGNAAYLNTSILQ
jgi:hypothetical protein